MSLNDRTIGVFTGFILFAPDPLVMGSRIEGSGIAGSESLRALALYGKSNFRQFVSSGDLQLAVESLRQFRRLHRDHEESRPAPSEWRFISYESLPDQMHCGAFLLLQSFNDARMDEMLALRARYSRQALPVISVTHGLAYSQELNCSLTSLILSETLPCDAIICCSEVARKTLSAMLENLGSRFDPFLERPARFEGQLPVIPWGVDTERFHPGDRRAARERLDLPAEPLLVLCHGRMSVATKMDLTPLLLAFRRIIKEMKRPVRLILSGPDRERYGERLLRLASELGLGNLIRLMGEVPDAALPDLYRSADLFVSLSDTLCESFGLTLTEAMASGLPVIASDWDGYREIVRDGETGFLVPTRWADCDAAFSLLSPLHDPAEDPVKQAQSVQVDVPVLADRLLRLLDDDAARSRMGEAGRRRAEETFAWPLIVGRYEALWSDLIERAKTTPFRGDPSPFGTMPPRSRLYEACPTAFVEPGDRLRWRGAAESKGFPELLASVEAFLPKESLKAVGSLVANSDEMTWAEATGRAAADLGMDADSAARSLLWLMKYGYLAREDAK